MYVVFVVAAALVLFAVVAVTIGRGDPMADDHPDVAGPDLGEPPLRADDLDDLRFPVAFRGYRMDQVDAVVERLREELRHRDERIAALEGSQRQEPPQTPGRPRPPWSPGA